MKFLLLFLLLISLSPNAQKVESIRILFVGNSLTYTNNLPALVQELARKQGIKVLTEMLAKPNYALEDHWLEGEFQRRIASGRLDFVVVQQGPSSQAEGRQMLMEYGQKFAEACESRSARLAFFMVWPSRQYYHTFDGVIKNYTDAAASTGALLCPVGQVWKAYQDSTADFSYYDYDGFHPSLAGSQVAAHIIFESLLSEKGR